MKIGPLNIRWERRSLANPEKWLTEWFSGRGQSNAGVNVTPKTALQYSAVFACVRILSETLGSLPLNIYRRLQIGGKEKALDHYLYAVLHDLPNPEMTSFELRETLMGHLALWGNAFAEIERDNAGRVIGLWPLRPDRMTVERDSGLLRETDWDAGGSLQYRYLLSKGQEVILRHWQVLHIRGLSHNGIIGYSPIRLAREAIGLGLATEEFGARFFGDGTHPGGVAEHPGKLGEQAYQNLKNSLTEAYSGLSKSHRLMILEEGMKFTQIGIPPDDAQFLETRKFQVTEIARIFRVPPHMLADLERATFSNIEHQSIEFVAHTIVPWLRRWEQAIKRDLFLPSERNTYFAEFLVDGLLRGDIKSRYEAYAVGRQNGWLSADDIRELENMNPLPDGQGKVYLIPLNMIPADQAGKQPAAGPEPPPVRAVENRALPEVRAVNIRRGITNSYKKVFTDAARRVLKREEADIMRKARQMLDERSADQFDVWLSEFYREHEEFIKRTMSPAFIAYAEAVQAAAAEEVGGVSGMTPELERFVDSYMANYIWRHTGLSITELRKAMAQAIAEGKDQLGALQETFDTWQETKPQEIAQEETIRAGNAIAMMAYMAAGVTQVRWVATGKSCPYCRRLDGKVVSVNSPFIGKGEAFEAAAGEERADKKKPPLIPGHDVKHPPAHWGCDCHLVSESRQKGVK